MAFILLTRVGMTLPVRGRKENSDIDATVRRVPPSILLQLSRDERDLSLDSRPTAPAPFWVLRVDEASNLPPLRIVEPEPRQTTPSIVKLAPPRRRWLSAACAAALILGGAAVANAFATAETSIVVP